MALIRCVATADNRLDHGYIRQADVLTCRLVAALASIRYVVSRLVAGLCIGKNSQNNESNYSLNGLTRERKTLMWIARTGSERTMNRQRTHVKVRLDGRRVLAVLVRWFMASS